MKTFLLIFLSISLYANTNNNDAKDHQEDMKISTQTRDDSALLQLIVTSPLWVPDMCEDIMADDEVEFKKEFEYLEDINKYISEVTEEKE